MVFRKSVIVSLLTLLSRVFGYVREIMMAVVLGAGEVANAFHLAFRFANVFRSFLAEGAFTASFVPVYSKHIAKDDVKGANIYASQTLTMLCVISLILVIVAEIFMPQIIYLLAPGFTDDKELLDKAIILARINFPYLFFMCISALFGGILGVFNSFSAVAISPLILNIMMMIALGMPISSKFDIAKILSVLIVISGAMQVVLVWYQVKKLKIKIKFARPKYTQDMKIFMKTFFPGVLSSSVTQINLWVSTALATFYDGLVSHLYYADRVLQFPLALIGASVSVVLLPVFSKMEAGKDDKINNLISQTIEVTMFMTLPILAVVTFLNKDFISFMFEYGAFSDHDAYRTGLLLGIMIFALPAYIINKILTPRFFSVHDTKTPFIAALIAMLFNLLINIAFLKYYSHFWSVSVATVISSWVNIIILLAVANKKNLYRATLVNLQKLPKIIFISLITAILSYYLSTHEFISLKQIDLPIKLLILIAIYLGLSSMLRIYKLQDLRKYLKK
ncbi:MAG: murein biosynthesis integral membrane protein MurJ [Alphaproteobacteria bacterium]|nr:murein biosynthesis integral membrane protein MurJ [Alphaproteobacteria bacterium]OJV16331.1 MAG: murein biosynthesis integral membrane protein MurJ [Alphaproteobacteria bacterium 33-17]